MVLLKLLKKVGFALLPMAILMAIFLIGPCILNFGKIPYGIKIANFEIGGKNEETARLIIEKKLNTFDFSLKSGNDTLIGISPQNLGINLLLDKSLQDAYSYGRTSNLIFNARNQILAAIFKKNLELKYDFDKEKFEYFLKNNFQKIEIIPQDATIVFNEKNNSFDIVPEKQGFIINKEKLISELNKRIYYTDSVPVIIEFKEALPKIKEADTLQAKETAEEILKNSPYFLSYQDGKRKIDSGTIA